MVVRTKYTRRPRRRIRPRRRYRPRRKYTTKPRGRREGVKPIFMPMCPPPRLLTKLVYTDTKEYTAAYPTISSQTYRTASLYDPDYTGAGGQPGWWDQIKTWYRAYIVRGCKIRFSLVNKGSETAKVNFIVTSSSDGPIATTLDWRNLSNFYNKELLIGPQGSGGNRYYSVYVDNYKAQGLSNLSSKLVQANPLVAAVGSSPALSPYIQIKCDTVDQSGTHDLIIKAEFIFYVECFNRKLAEGEDS